jgi:mannose-1-phosphate guanylyltransferase
MIFMKVRQAVVMVGGKGTRLLPLTENNPKPILSVADKPCIWYLLRSLARAGIEEVILACGYKPGHMEILGDGSDLGMKIIYSYEDEPMGTGGAMKLVEDRLDETFVACNGDVFADIDVAEEISVHQKTDAKITIALTPVENPTEYGIVRLDDEDRIVEFKEKPKQEEVFSNLINAGVYIVQRSVLGYVPKNQFFDFSKDLLPLVMNDGGRIQGYKLTGLWMDVGRPHDLLGANLTVAEREYGNKSFPAQDACTRGVFYMGPGSKVGNSETKSTVILKDCTVEDSYLDRVLVMKGSKVKGAHITDSIIGEGCTVKEGCRISNAVLADNTVLEPGTELDGGRVV